MVTIIGFGNIGRIISTLLLPYNEITFHLNIMDPDHRVQGAILDLKHGAQLYPHTISYNSSDLFNQSDFIFHCAGALVPRGKSRLVTCLTSIEITEAVFNHFKPAKEPFIIVVANPVEIISHVTQKITGIPKQNIIGTGTLVDSIRMNYIVKQEYNDVSSVNAVLLGEHGATAYLSEQLSTINGLPFHQVFDPPTLNKLLLQVKTSAEQIKTTQKATIYGIGYCALQIFESLLSSHGKKLAVSTFIPEHLKHLLSPANYYLSFFSEINSSGAYPIKDYHPLTTELELLQKSANKILSHIPSTYI